MLERFEDFQTSGCLPESNHHIFRGLLNTYYQQLTCFCFILTSAPSSLSFVGKPTLIFSDFSSGKHVIGSLELFDIKTD